MGELQGGSVAALPKKKLVAGKDVKAQQFKIGEKTVTLGFTKSNELFVGRLAMLGVATSIVGEVCLTRTPQQPQQNDMTRASKK